MLPWAVGLLVIVAAFYFLVYSPKTNEAATLAKQLGAERADAARLQKEAQQKEELEREIADSQSATGAIEAKLPSASEIPRLLEQLDKLAGQTGVTLTSIKPGALERVTVSPSASTEPPRTGRDGARSTSADVRRTPKVSQAKTADYQKFTIDLETKGTFSATMKFVHALEDFPRFLALSDMRLTPVSPRSASPQRIPFFSTTEEDPSDPVLRLAITATAYTRLEGGGDTP
jgi:Tfp pilus assembly protein PilO